MLHPRFAPVRRSLVAVLAAAGWALLAAIPVLADDPVTVAASVDREVSSVGDRITLTVEVLRGPGILISQPQAVSFGEDIEPVDGRAPVHVTDADGSVHSRFTFILAAFRTGELRLAPISVTYTNPDGSTGVALSNPLAFTIRSVIPPGQNPQDIRDLKPQLSLGSGTPSAFYRPLLAALLVLDLGLIVLALRGRPARQRRPVPQAAPVAANPWVAQLDVLNAEGLVDSGDYKNFYRRVAVIVRSFLDDRYDIPAKALTRAELEGRMGSAGFDPWQARLVNGLLQEADRVVYAEYAPARERAEGALGLAYQVVEAGIPQAQEPVLVGA